MGYLVLLDEDFLSSERCSERLLARAKLDFMFSSAGVGGYFKNEKCTELDSELGDIHGALVDLEAKAVRYLEAQILPHAKALVNATSLSSELDCLMSLAVVSRENRWACPKFDPGARGVDIREGRHALLELLKPGFIPNSVCASAGHVYIITGPNCSGKSVLCKQVALIVVLAQVGSFVPASSCKLSVFDSILTRIESMESVSVAQSSFAIDSSQVASMFRYSTSQTLLVLDEWGKGTNETDGMALFAATVLGLLDRPVELAPVCIATTHFTELLGSTALPLSKENLEVLSMETVVKGCDDRDQNALFCHEPVYLHKLIPGLFAGESRAIHSAAAAGVPRNVLRRALEVRGAVQTESPLTALAVIESDSRMSRIIAAVKKFLSLNLDDIGASTFKTLEALPL